MAHSRMTQDRRSNSRIMLLYDCHFTYDEKNYDAVVLDLSLKGAFISAKILPPKGSKIILYLNGPLLKKTLQLEGKVVHGGAGISETGRTGRFGVGFASAPVALLELISKIISKNTLGR